MATLQPLCLPGVTEEQCTNKSWNNSLWRGSWDQGLHWDLLNQGFTALYILVDIIEVGTPVHSTYLAAVNFLDVLNLTIRQNNTILLISQLMRAESDTKA